MRVNPLRERKAQHLSGFYHFGIDLADRREGVQVEREDHPQRHQQDLGQLADPEPQDEQGDQAQVRQRADHLHGRVHRGFEPTGQSDCRACADPDHPTQDQPLDNPDGGDLQRGGELAVTDQLDSGLDDQRRRGQHILRDDTDRAAQLPQGQQRQRGSDAHDFPFAARP